MQLSQGLKQTHNSLECSILFYLLMMLTCLHKNISSSNKQRPFSKLALKLIKKFLLDLYSLAAELAYPPYFKIHKTSITGFTIFIPNSQQIIKTMQDIL